MGLSNSLSTAVRLPIREVLLRCSSIRLCSDLTPVLSAVYLADRTTSQAIKENHDSQTSQGGIENQTLKTSHCRKENQNPLTSQRNQENY